MINQSLAADIKKPQRDTTRMQQTLNATESAALGKVVDASHVHSWLNSWGKDTERSAPRSDK